MSFRVQIESLRKHAAALEAESKVWDEAIQRKVVFGDIDLTGDALTVAGGDLQTAYRGVITQYSSHISAVSWALSRAADMLRRSADTYGDTDAIIADHF